MSSSFEYTPRKASENLKLADLNYYLNMIAHHTDLARTAFTALQHEASINAGSVSPEVVRLATLREVCRRLKDADDTTGLHIIQNMISKL